MSGAATAALRSGETKRVQVALRRGVLIATAFVVHFRFDKSFVEPCMRGVLREVLRHAAEHADQKLVIVGHTDRSGSEAYNQSLSERRARSVFAYLTAGRDAAAAQAEWGELRRAAAGALPTVRDTWARTSTSTCCRIWASTRAMSTAITATRPTARCRPSELPRACPPAPPSTTPSGTR